MFFATHDPTTPDRQGHDVGPQYRSIVLYETDAQRGEAERVISELESENVFGAPIVTEIQPLERFYPAEEYHQDYYRQNTMQGYCMAVIPPKLAKLKEKFGKEMA